MLIILKLLNKKGISLIEVMIAMFLTAIAVISILPMQDMSMRTAGQSDSLGRAAGILQAELESCENQIMSTGAVPTTPANQTITVSGGASVGGDATFNLVTATRVNPNANNSWIINVRVTWPAGCAGAACRSIASSRIAIRQIDF